MFKSNLIGKTVKIVAIGTICLSLAIPSVVNAAHDVYKPEETVVPICDFTDATADNLNTDYAKPEDVGYNKTVSVSLDEDDGNKKIKVTTLSQDNGGSLDNSYFVLMKDQSVSLVNEQAPYLVFNMKAGASGNAEMKFSINTPKGRYFLIKNAVLERSKDFSDSNEEVKKFTANEYGAVTGGFLSDTEYEYRLNLEQAFGDEAYANIGEWWGIAISIYNWAPTDYYYDNFRLESGNDKYAYQTFDGISNADDVAWYHNDFSASIENLGYLNSPALKLTGKGNANTQIVFDRGHTVNLLANGNYLYWYMDVDYDATNLQYKPQFINMGMKIITENWTGNEGLIYQDTAITYSESLSGVINGAGYALPDWNANEWNVRIPVGKHWFCMDLTKVFKSDYSEEYIKTSLKQAKSLYLQYNSDQENAGGWNWQSFADVEATFIIDSISSFVKEITDGDANCDGTVDILDLIRVKKYAAGIQTEICAAADLDGNSEINAADSILLRNKLLEK